MEGNREKTTARLAEGDRVLVWVEQGRPVPACAELGAVPAIVEEVALHRRARGEPFQYRVVTSKGTLSAASAQTWIVPAA